MIGSVLTMRECREFDVMFREWYRPFFYFAYRYVKDEEVCRDIVSETFAVLWQNFDTIARPTAKSYLLFVLRTKCIDYLRHQQVHDNYIQYATQLNDTFTHEGTLEELEYRVSMVRSSMEKLTPYNRNILEQCYIHHKKYKEVAEDLGVSVAAIHKNIVKALRILRKELKHR